MSRSRRVSLSSPEKDPGTGGKKLSKSDGEAQLEARNKSFNKILDAQFAYLSAHGEEAEELRIRWQKKAEWHEKEYGW